MNERYLRPAGADLFRVLAVGMVGAFHFWQQSWVGLPGLDFLARSGGAWVDGMILLSAFCLYLPYAHAWAQGKAFPGCRGFLQRRAVRILPSYYFAVLVSALVWMAAHRPDRDFWLDLGSHLLLIPTLVPQGYVYCRTNGALWTVGVLVLFYLLFPLLARAFYAWPLPVLAGLCAAQELYARCRVLPLQGVDYSMRFNQLPAEADKAPGGFLRPGGAGGPWGRFVGAAPHRLLAGRSPRPAGLAAAADALLRGLPVGTVSGAAAARREALGLSQRHQL